jgi:hypothetical protein
VKHTFFGLTCVRDFQVPQDKKLWDSISISDECTQWGKSDGDSDTSTYENLCLSSVTRWTGDGVCAFFHRHPLFKPFLFYHVDGAERMQVCGIVRSGSSLTRVQGSGKLNEAEAQFAIDILSAFHEHTRNHQRHNLSKSVTSTCEFA